MVGIFKEFLLLLKTGCTKTNKFYNKSINAISHIYYNSNDGVNWLRENQTTLATAADYSLSGYHFLDLAITNAK